MIFSLLNSVRNSPRLCRGAIEESIACLGAKTVLKAGLNQKKTLFFEIIPWSDFRGYHLCSPILQTRSYSQFLAQPSLRANLHKGINSKENWEKDMLRYSFASPICKIQRMFMSASGINGFVGTSAASHEDRKKEFLEKFREEISYLKDIRTLSVEEARNVASGFIYDMGQLYLSYFQYHLDEAHQYGNEHKELLEQAKRPIRFYQLDLEAFLQGAFEGFGEWEIVCERRTNIEAFNAMFAGVVEPLDTQDIEDYMQQRKKTEKMDPSRVPPNVPKDHWWWWWS